MSKNVNLVTLNVNNNELKSITLPNQEENNTLTYLDVFANQLTSLDVSNLHALTFLHADDNQLTHLDLSENPLTQSHGFVARNNYLESITLPNNNVEYPWTTFLQTQLFPRDKLVGYKVVWYTNLEKTDVLDPFTTPTIRCTGQTLYAQYVPITYTVEFKSGGETGTMESQIFQYGTVQNLNANQFEKAHYVFGGWKSTNGRTFDDQQSVQNLTDTDGAPIVLTATWKEKDYTGGPYNIVLHSNNGSDTTQKVSNEFGVNKTLPKNTFTKDHYDIKGWSSSSSNQNVIYTDEDIVTVNPPQVIGGNTLNLYAVWERNQVEVTVKDGTSSQVMTLPQGDKLALETPSKVGYIFAGWQVNETDDFWNM